MRRIKVFVESSFNRSDVFASYDVTQPNELIATFKTKAHKSLAHMFKSAFDMHQNTVYAQKNLLETFESFGNTDNDNIGNTTSAGNYYDRRNGKLDRMDRYNSSYSPPARGVTFSPVKKSS